MSTLTAAAVDTSKLCQVTNDAKSGYNIVVGMPITSIEKDNSPNPLLSSSGNFEVLTLSDGKSTVIAPGSSGTVTLDRTITDDTGTNYEYGYDLLISSAKWFAPLANISVVQNLYPVNFDPITVTADD